MKLLMYSPAFLFLVSCGNSGKTTPETTPDPAPAEETLQTKPPMPDTDSWPIYPATEPLPATKTESKPVPQETRSSGNKPGKPTLHGSWELEKVYGAKEPFKLLFPDKVPVATFDLRTYTVNGNNGCNQYNGPFTLRNGVLGIKDLMATKMYCEGVNEHLYMTTLQMANGYKFEGEKLILTLDGEGLLLFRPKK